MPCSCISDRGVIRTTRPEVLVSDDTQNKVPLLVVGASLSLAIAVIHLQDQGGLLGDQSPFWLKYSYYLVEISSTVSAALIIRGKCSAGCWGWRRAPGL